MKATENISDRIIETRNGKNVSISKYTTSTVIIEKHVND